jgi:putative DNA primase/helicase
MAAKLDAALLGVTHFTKGSEGRSPIDRVTGSVAFGALARIVMVAARQQDGDDGKPGSRVLMRAKSNIGPDDGGVSYDLQLVPMLERPDIIASVVSWGDSVSGNARDILACAEAILDADEITPRREAEDFMLDFLMDGPKPAKEIRDAARDAGHAPRTVARAKAALGIASVKNSMTGGWVWSLPEGCHQTTKDAKNPCQGNVASFAERGTLQGESEAICANSSETIEDGWENEI